MNKLTFGKYRLVAELGQGGMADVILALSQGPVGFSKLVVIKRLREHLAEDPEFVGMLIDEARLAARLNHPNIVHTNEVGETEGRFFIAMEYLEGQPLTRVLRRAKRKKKPLTTESQLQILCDVLAGLHYAHELTDYDGTPLGVVHRDVTPSNVFVTYDGVVKLVDFGIAKASGRSTETKTGVVKGKMTYMPPEQALGQEVDQRADVFSVGVMLWEAVTGRRMWKGIDDVVVLGKLINGDIPTSPQKEEPSVPDELDAICRKALDPDPGARYASALEFQEAIEGYLASCEARVSNRELGALVSELFQADRKGIRQIIESQLSKLKEEPAGSLEPVMIPESMASSHSFSSTSNRAPMASEADVGPAVSNGTSSTTGSSGAGERPRRSVIGLGAALVAVVAAIVWVVGRSPSDQKDPATTSPTATATATATAAPTAASTATATATAARSAEKKEEVRLTLRATPSAAQFSIDSGEWLDNPHVRRVPFDESRHEIRVRADGYKEKNIMVPFDQDVVLDVKLDPEPRRPRGPRPQPAPKNTGTRPGDLPTPPKPSPRPLLPGNPWED